MRVLVATKPVAFRKGMDGLDCPHEAALGASARIEHRRGRLIVHVRVGQDFRCRKVHDQHIASVIETSDVVTDDRLRPIADRMPLGKGFEQAAA